MRPSEVISSLQRRGVTLKIVAGSLKIGGADKLTDREKAALKTHKSSILQALTSTTATTAGADSASVAPHVEATEPAVRECRNCVCFEPYPFEPILGSCYALKRMQHATSKPARFGCDNFEPKESPS